MKKEPSENIVRIEGIPKLNAKQIEQLRKLSTMPDDKIDLSDIPEITNFTGFARRRGPQKTPLKKPVAIRLSQDVIDYFKGTGKGWQGRIDAILHEWVNSHKAA
jgi:uncharacterized protein (DUF4415 family)